jgi:hypothetical protein
MKPPIQPFKVHDLQRMTTPPPPLPPEIRYLKKPEGEVGNNNILLYTSILFALLAMGGLIYSMYNNGELNKTMAALKTKLDDQNQILAALTRNLEQLNNDKTENKDNASNLPKSTDNSTTDKKTG